MFHRSADSPWPELTWASRHPHKRLVPALRDGIMMRPIRPALLLRGPFESVTTPTNFSRVFDMADILALRTAMRAASAALAADQATLAQLEDELGQPDLPPQFRLILQRRAIQQERVVAAATQNFNNAQSAYQAAVLADPIHAADPGLPLVLLPVRLETAYLPGAAGTDLV